MAGGHLVAAAASSEVGATGAAAGACGAALGAGGSDERGSGGPGSRHLQPALHAAADLLVRVPAGGGAAGAAPAEGLSRSATCTADCPVLGTSFETISE